MAIEPLKPADAVAMLYWQQHVAKRLMAIEPLKHLGQGSGQPARCRCKEAYGD